MHYKQNKESLKKKQNLETYQIIAQEDNKYERVKACGYIHPLTKKPGEYGTREANKCEN